MKKQTFSEIPPIEQLEAELNRVKAARLCRRGRRRFICLLSLVVILAVLAVTSRFSVLRINGTSMSPTLQNGEIVISAKTSEFEAGDLAAFYFHNQILVKRVLGESEEQITMDTVGRISQEQMAGRIVFRIWPLARIGRVK